MIDSFSGTNHFLSNFYPCKIEVLGLTFNSVEEAYQAFKSEDPEVQKKFVGIGPGKAKALGKTVKLRPKWDIVKLAVMESLLRLKFSDPALKEKLDATKGKTLIEGNNHGDRYWGVCKGEGWNNLGRLLMEIRDDEIQTLLHNRR